MKMKERETILIVHSDLNSQSRMMIYFFYHTANLFLASSKKLVRMACSDAFVRG